MAPDPIRDLLARALGAQYEIGPLIGRGGMGAVYRAHEKALDREVAIKVLPPDVADQTPDGRARFMVEARTAAQLTHSSIVPLYTFGEIEGVAFFIMGFVRGESLSDKLKREGALAPEVARRILSQLADALEYAHKKGVVHRDIKPDNVLIEQESGRALLADFGIAKPAKIDARLTRTGMIVGTPAYMSPEQAAGDREIDGRSDLYSLGVLGYEMVAGHPPFAATDASAVMMQHATTIPTSLGTIKPETPSALAAAVTRCLAKSPDDRFIDALSLRAALDLPDDSDELLPESLRSVRSLAAGMALPVYMAGLFVIGVAVKPEMLPGLKVMTLAFTASLFGILTLLLPAFVIVDARVRGKHSWSEIRHQALLPTKWWVFPWPRRWSPPVVSDRFPANLRRARRWLQAMVGVLTLITLPLIVASLFGPKTRLPWLAAIAMGTLFAVEIPAIIAIQSVVKWARKRGLSGHVATQLTREPAFSPFWHKPQIAALLEPEPVRVDTRSPRSPREALLAIEELARRGPAELKPLLDQSVRAARDGIAEVEALDREIAALSGDIKPGEATRLEERLALAGGDREVRALLESQLALVRSISQRMSDLAQRRERVNEMVRTLWLQLVDLRAAQERDRQRADDITGRVRALCASVAHEVSARQDVAKLLSDDATRSSAYSSSS